MNFGSGPSYWIESASVGEWRVEAAELCQGGVPNLLAAQAACRPGYTQAPVREWWAGRRGGGAVAGRVVHFESRGWGQRPAVRRRRQHCSTGY